MTNLETLPTSRPATIHETPLSVEVPVLKLNELTPKDIRALCHTAELLARYVDIGDITFASGDQETTLQLDGVVSPDAL